MEVRGQLHAQAAAGHGTVTAKRSLTLHVLNSGTERTQGLNAFVGGEMELLSTDHV
jgi:hypothetical protein